MPILTCQSESVRPESPSTESSAKSPVRVATPQYPTWRAALRDAIRCPEKLCRLLDLPDALTQQAQHLKSGLERKFPLLVPRSYVARMTPGDPNDPLLRQVLPLWQESEAVPGFDVDPVGDGDAALGPGLLQKYHGRALLVVTGACAVHCRYCFRRHFPYGEVPKSVDAWRPALEAIRRDDSIREVILSGGDPLTLVDGLLSELVDRIAAIPHVQRLRVHTRWPVVLPQRVTDELLDWLTGSRLTPIVVLHANHANELTGDVPPAIAALAHAGIPLLNQAVLLHGVNDSLEAQVDLCERLVDLRVMPYYLHQLDRVRGAAHFEVPLEHGKRIVEQLRMRLPGYAVPQFVQEIPGAKSKVIVG